MGRRRAVVKDMTKMAAAVRAMNFGAHHVEGSIDPKVSTAPSIGSLKLGQPVPLSNFPFDLK